MKALITSILLILANPLFASECENLSWKRTTMDGHWVTYRGHVKPGTYSIHAELWRGNRIIAQDLDFPNPSGNFEMFVYADYKVRGSDKPRFHCE